MSTTGADPAFIERPPWGSGALDSVLRKWLLIVKENRKVLKKISLTTLKCFKTTEYFPKALGFVKTYVKNQLLLCKYVSFCKPNIAVMP